MLFEITDATPVAQRRLLRTAGSVLAPAGGATGQSTGSITSNSVNFFNGTADFNDYGNDVGAAEDGLTLTSGLERASTASLATSRKSRVASWLTQQSFSATNIETMSFLLSWDESASLYGDVHDLILKYYVLDDTMDVSHIKLPGEDGKYASHAIIKRQKVPKDVDHSAPLQGLEAGVRYVAETSFKSGLAKKSFSLQDRNKVGAFIHWSDLIPGNQHIENLLV